MMMAACTPSVPDGATDVERAARVLPDNDGATLPPNIAPLCFEIQEEGDRFVTRLSTRGGRELVVGGRSVDIDVAEWHQLLADAAGDTLWTDVYARQEDRWQHFRRMANPVVRDSIDPYITYRLIRPSYVCYEELSLVERNVENFDERTFYSNMALSRDDNGQCVNCHVPQRQGQTGRSQFHARQAYGGTVLIDGTDIRKVNLRTDSTLSAGVYPAWHPTLPLIAYSVNETGQAFHTLDPQKIEVIDYASDLILYDPEQNEVHSITRTSRDYESFPTWSPDGRTLYYISAHHDPVGTDIDVDLDQNYQTLHYNIYAREFDPSARRFGPARLVFDAEALGKSASTPRISPDGRWLLFSLADYGQFHIWHRSADLCVVPLDAEDCDSTMSSTCGTRQFHVWNSSVPRVELTLASRTEEANSTESDSYHSWSSNGRWILFSSRRTDGNYTRLYLSYFDRQGHAHRPVLLPQRRPHLYDELFRSFNAAEWMTQPVASGRSGLSRALQEALRRDARQARYAGSALAVPEADSVATQTRITKQNYHNIYEND